MTNDVLSEMPCRELVELITDYLEDRLSPVDRRRFETHLATCEACLGMPPARLQCAREVLRDHGNMSSPTVLFVLERFLRTTPSSGALGMAAAFGPGFSAEGVVFAW